MPGNVSVTGIALKTPPQEHAVDEQGEVGDEPEEAVVDEHVDEHHEEADQARDEGLVQRVFAERRRDLLLLGDVQPDRQGAVIEHEGEVFGVGDGHVAALDDR